MERPQAWARTSAAISRSPQWDAVEADLAWLEAATPASPRGLVVRGDSRYPRNRWRKLRRRPWRCSIAAMSIC